MSVTREQCATAADVLRGLEEWCREFDESAKRHPECWGPAVDQHMSDALRVTGDCRRHRLLRAAALVRAARWVLEREER